MLTRLVARLFLPLALLGALAACDSLPDDVEREATRIDNGITELGETLAARRADYEQIQNNSDQWSFFKPYAEREDWAGTFDAVESDLDNLRARFDAEAAPIIEADESEGAERLRTILTGIAANFDPTRDKMNSVSARMELLREGYENAPRWMADARAFVTQIESEVDSVQDEREQAKTDFPSRVDAIDERFAPLSRLLSQANTALETAEAEFAKHESGQNADYAAFADAYTTTRDNAAAAVTAAEEYQQQLASLYREYTTVLRDMKTEYRVIIGRSAWDNCCDGSAYEQTQTYPEQSISPAAYEHLMQLSQGERQGEQGYLARRYYSWGSWNQEVFIDQAVWDHIGINMGASWPNRSFDEAMFWIEDIYPAYFHKYAEVNGTNVTEGDWEEVDADTYGLHADDFGMAIESKALGQFANEAINEAIPPGMDRVGDPRYGEWVSDGQGGQEWSFLETYAMYHLLFGGSDRHYYSRNDHNGYRDWRSERDRPGAVTAANYGWYGQNRNSPKYGSNGRLTTQTPAYKSSPFARSGGAASVSQSVRNAGANARGRGAANRAK